LSPALLAALLLTAASVPARAQGQQDFSKVEIKTTKVSSNFYTLEGQGGTIGVLSGPDGVFMVDAQFAPLSEKIVAAIRKGASPRHVPDDILGVPGIPRTMTGKRLEIPIKRILLGANPDEVVSASAVDKPDLLVVFAEHART